MGSYQCFCILLLPICPTRKAMTNFTCMIWQLTLSVHPTSTLIMPIVLTRDDTEWGRSWARWIAYRSFFKMLEPTPYKKQSVRDLRPWAVTWFQYFAPPKIIVQECTWPLAACAVVHSQRHAHDVASYNHLGPGSKAQMSRRYICMHVRVRGK